MVRWLIINELNKLDKSGTDQSEIEGKYEPSLGQSGRIFSHERTAPLFTGITTGKKVHLNHKNLEFRPLDFSFTSDTEVDAEIACRGVTFGQRVLVLPGVVLLTR